MKIILATDPVFWPLTGIGKYTLELAKGLSHSNSIEDLRFFNMGRWQPIEDLRQFGNKNAGKAENTGWAHKSFSMLRRSLANHKLTTATYARIAPLMFRQRLKSFAHDYIYHSPNFMLPPFSGKKIATFHDLSVLKYPEFHPESRVTYLRPEILRSARVADHIITDSEAVRQEIIEYFARNPNEVSVIPLASTLVGEPADPVALDKFLTTHELTKGRFFLFVSSIEPRKNIERILDAYSALPAIFRERNPLVMTGSSGWKSTELLKRIKTLGNAGQVQYLDYSSDMDLIYLYQSAGALVFPSVYEGFGLPIIEAQSMGVPVLTSNRSCMPEVAGEAALLVNPFDVDDIRHALEQIMVDDALRRNLIRDGLHNARRFSWENTVSKTLDVYARVR